MMPAMQIPVQTYSSLPQLEYYIRGETDAILLLFCENVFRTLFLSHTEYIFVHQTDPEIQHSLDHCCIDRHDLCLEMLKAIPQAKDWSHPLYAKGCIFPNSMCCFKEVRYHSPEWI